MHVQVGDDPRPVGERLAPLPPCAGAVGRPRSRSPRAPARRPRTSARSASARAVAPSRSRSSSSSASRAAAAAASSGCASTPRGWAIAQPAAAASSVTRRRPSTPGTKIAAVFSSAARAGAVARGAEVHAAARSRGIAGRPISGRVRSRTTSQPGSSRSCAHDAACDHALVRAQLDDDRLLLAAPARRASVSTPGESSGSRRGTAPRPRRAPRSESAISASSRAEQLLALRARRRVAEPVRRGERGDGERVACRAARGTRATAGPARSRGRRRSSPWASASDRFACTPTGTPICERREIGTAGPTAITSARSPRASARRPASRSAARVEGASTVTSWPSAAQRGRDARRRARSRRAAATTRTASRDRSASSPERSPEAMRDLRLVSDLERARARRFRGGSAR